MKNSLLIIFLFICSFVWTQNKIVTPGLSKGDSLLALLKTNPPDTTKLRLLVTLSEECDPTDILKYAKPAVELADKLLNEDEGQINNSTTLQINKCKALALNNIGFSYNSQGQIKEALEYFTRSLKIREQLNDKSGIASSLINIGLIYNAQGQIKEALEYFSRALKIQEQINDKPGIAYSLNNIGFIYNTLGQRKEALEYFTRALKIREQLNDKRGIGNSLNNVGFVYNMQGQITEALDCYSRSLKLFEELNDKRGIAGSLLNIGFIYKMQGQFKEALAYSSRSLRIHEQINDKRGTANSLNNIGSIYLKQATLQLSPKEKAKMFALALAYADSSLAVAKQIGYAENICNAEQVLASIYKTMGNKAKAFDHYEQYIIYRDSISNQETRKASIKKQLAYEYERKAAAARAEQEKQSAVAAAESRRQQYVLILVSSFLILVLVLAGFIFRSLRITRKQKNLIEKQKQLVEEHQKEILDSIHYARRIQNALLPSANYIEKHLNRVSKTN